MIRAILHAYRIEESRMPPIPAETIEFHRENARHLRAEAYRALFGRLLRRIEAAQKAIAARLQTPSSTQSTAA